MWPPILDKIENDPALMQINENIKYYERYQILNREQELIFKRGIEIELAKFSGLSFFLPLCAD